MKSSLELSASGVRGLNSRCDAKIWQTSSMTSVETDLFASKSMILEDVSLTNSRNWSRISVDNLAASLLPGLWVGPMFSPCSDLLK